MKNLDNLYKTFINMNISNEIKGYYIDSYNFYISFFAEKEQLKEQDVIIGLGFVYSWMPTIPKNVNFNILKEVTILLNKAKQGYDFTDTDYVTLKKLCNNSLVGSSKLLHFINPNKYAIWDSKIYSFLYEDKASYKYKVENIAKYKAYLELMNKVSISIKFRPIIEKNKKQFPYHITDFRVIEWMFFNYKKGKK